MSNGKQAEMTNELTQRVSLLALSVAVASMLFACGAPAEIKIGAESNGGRVELQKGQTLSVSLESNPTTGFRWEIAELKDGILLLEGDAQFEPQSALVGAPGVETLHFEAVETGETTLKLVYRRPWEIDVEPLETFTVNAVIR